MDFDKFLGDSVTTQIVKETGWTPSLPRWTPTTWNRPPRPEKFPWISCRPKAGPSTATNGAVNSKTNAGLVVASATAAPPATNGASPADADSAAPTLEMPRISVDFPKYANWMRWATGRQSRSCASSTTICRWRKRSWARPRPRSKARSGCLKRGLSPRRDHARRNLLRKRRLEGEKRRDRPGVVPEV